MRCKAESLLRHHKVIPSLFKHGEGAPIDERHFDCFAFKLYRASTRAAFSSERVSAV